MVWMAFHQQNMSITSLWKRQRYQTETYLTQTQILHSQLPFHSLWESGVWKSNISHFFFSNRLSKESDSGYISHWIDLCFQQSSPLLVRWLVEQWQIGFTFCTREHNGVALTELRETEHCCTSTLTPPSLIFLLTTLPPPLSSLSFTRTQKMNGPVWPGRQWCLVFCTTVPTAHLSTIELTVVAHFSLLCVL